MEEEPKCFLKSIEMDERNLCFATYVFGNYQKYIPYYIYSISRLYPHSSIKIFLDTSLDENISGIIKKIEKKGFSNHQVIPHFETIKEFQNIEIKGGAGKLNRWILESDMFSDFEFVYVGDVDILFLPEEIPLLDFHKKQMEILKVPFSNKVRVDENGFSAKRLTGLHFFKTKEYLEEIRPILSVLKNDEEFRADFFSGIERDEHFLYKLNKLAFDFDDDVLTKAQRPWHGLHLGITRARKKIDIETIKENSSLSIPEIKEYLAIITKDELFQQIQKAVYLIELDEILRELKIPRMFLWKLNYFHHLRKWRINQLKKKIKTVLR